MDGGFYVDDVTNLINTVGMKNDIANLLTKIGKNREIALECGVAPIAVYRWKTCGRIPSRHLAGVLRVSARNNSGVTAYDLCVAHEGASQ